MINSVNTPDCFQTLEKSRGDFSSRAPFFVIYSKLKYPRHNERFPESAACRSRGDALAGSIIRSGNARIAFIAGFQRHSPYVYRSVWVCSSAQHSVTHLGLPKSATGRLHDCLSQHREIEYLGKYTWRYEQRGRAVTIFTALLNKTPDTTAECCRQTSPSIKYSSVCPIFQINANQHYLRRTVS